ncbi:MAG: ribonuclease HI family protein [Patescibacteria group bacterium]
MHKIIIYTDGGARNNPGPAGAGVFLIDGAKQIECKKYLGSQTNNWAEYEAVLLALAEARKRGLAGREIEVRADSKLIVEQISGNWKIKEPALKLQHAKVRAMITADFPNIRFVYVPREENKEADRLVNDAIDEAQ